MCAFCVISVGLFFVRYKTQNLILSPEQFYSTQIVRKCCFLNHLLDNSEFEQDEMPVNAAELIWATTTFIFVFFHLENKADHPIYCTYRYQYWFSCHRWALILVKMAGTALFQIRWEFLGIYGSITWTSWSLRLWTRQTLITLNSFVDVIYLSNNTNRSVYIMHLLLVNIINNCTINGFFSEALSRSHSSRDYLEIAWGSTNFNSDRFKVPLWPQMPLPRDRLLIVLEWLTPVGINHTSTPDQTAKGKPK